MRHTLTLITSLTVIATLAACNGSGAAENDSETPSTLAEDGAQAVESVGPDTSDDLSAESAPQAVEVDTQTADPLTSLESNGEQLGSTPTEVLPDGTLQWSEDGCLWGVAQGYWVATGTCYVPDVNNVPVVYLYPMGTDPTQTWYQEVSIDPTVTQNGVYYVFFIKGLPYWNRCHTDCNNITNYEIFDGTYWWTYDQVNTAYQQQLSQAQTTPIEAIIGGTYVGGGGGSDYTIGVNSAALEDQGAPSGITPELLVDILMQESNDRIIDNILHDTCYDDYYDYDFC